MFVDLPGYEAAQLFAVRVVGRSMDLVYPEGALLICLKTAEAGVRSGDHAIVRRHRNGLVETTVKEVVQENGGITLYPRSTEATHQPIRYKRDEHSDEGIEIIGVVLTHQNPLRRREGPLLNI